jgi:hypothetical protein
VPANSSVQGGSVDAFFFQQRRPLASPEKTSLSCISQSTAHGLPHALSKLYFYLFHAWSVLMNTYLSRPSLIVSLAAAIATAVPASAGLVITFEESGSDVVATLSGSFASLAGGAPDKVPIANAVVSQSSNFTSTNEAGPFGSKLLDVNSYSFTGVGFPAFGTSPAVYQATALSGQNTSFGFIATTLWLAQSYTAGTEFTGSLTWADKSIASLQLTPGS